MNLKKRSNPPDSVPTLFDAAVLAGLPSVVETPTLLHRQVRVWASAEDQNWAHKALTVCEVERYSYTETGDCEKWWGLCYVLLPNQPEVDEKNFSWATAWSHLVSMAALAATRTKKIVRHVGQKTG